MERTFRTWWMFPRERVSELSAIVLIASCSLVSKSTVRQIPESTYEARPVRLFPMRRSKLVQAFCFVLANCSYSYNRLANSLPTTKAQ